MIRTAAHTYTQSHPPHHFLILYAFTILEHDIDTCHCIVSINKLTREGSSKFVPAFLCVFAALLSMSVTLRPHCMLRCGYHHGLVW